MKICFATSNTHKIKEVKALLGERFELIGLVDIGFEGDLAEDYFTIEENSKQKAEFIYNNYNINCFADDSGLEVYALNNEPGVRSARYAGEPKSDVNNIRLLLKNLEGIQNRNARFKTIITLFINGAFHQFEGIIEGEIISESRGASGFGYDPVFIPSGYNQTFAEMPLDQKNKISHRGIAVSKLVSFLQDYPTK